MSAPSHSQVTDDKAWIQGRRVRVQTITSEAFTGVVCAFDASSETLALRMLLAQAIV